MAERENPFQVIITPDTARPVDIPFGETELREPAFESRNFNNPEIIYGNRLKSGGMKLEWSTENDDPAWKCTLYPRINPSSNRTVQQLINDTPPSMKREIRQSFVESFAEGSAQPSLELTPPTIPEIIHTHLPSVTMRGNSDWGEMVYSHKFSAQILEEPHYNGQKRKNVKHDVHEPISIFPPALAGMFEGYWVGSVLIYSGKRLQEMIQDLNEMISNGSGTEDKVRELVDLHFAIFPK